MPRLKDELSFQPLLSLFRAVVFHHAVAFLLLPQCCAGQFQVIGPAQPIVAAPGDDIILPCLLKPSVDASEMTIEWSRPDLDPRFVLVWRDGMELQNKQHPSYNGRTSLLSDELKYGRLSLKLSRVKPSDEGKYRCFIPTSLKESTVELIVGVASFIVIRLETADDNKWQFSNRLVLQCEAKGWYPEPELFWLDGEGNLLSAGPTETVRGPDDLYTVSRRLTVRKSDSFTCRVQQKNITQTRETHFYVPEDLLTAPSSSAVYILVALVAVCFLLFSATFIFYWKLRKEKGYKIDHVCGTGHGEELEDLQPKEQKDIICGISVLMAKMKELEMSREKQKSQQEEAEREKEKIEKAIEPVRGPLSWFTDGKKKLELEKKKTECEKSLQSIKDRLQETEDAITRIRDWTKKVQEEIVDINKELEETKGRRDEIQLESEKLEKNTEASPLTQCPDTN